MRAIIHEAAPKAPIAKMQTMRDDLFGLVATKWFYTMILGLFGAMALALAALGVYGAVSVAVSMRTHEIGVRMALGASGNVYVRTTVLREGLLLAAAGGVIGAVASLWMATRLLLDTGLLFQVTPRDPLTFAVGSRGAARRGLWQPVEGAGAPRYEGRSCNRSAIRVTHHVPTYYRSIDCRGDARRPGFEARVRGRID